MKLIWNFSAHHPTKDGSYNEYIIWPGPNKECTLPSLSRLKEICSKILGDKLLNIKILGESMVLIHATVGSLTGTERKKLTELTRIIGKETKETS